MSRFLAKASNEINPANSSKAELGSGATTVETPVQSPADVQGAMDPPLKTNSMSVAWFTAGSCTEQLRNMFELQV
jgi:hypothetical protein